MEFAHTPVLLEECLNALAIQPSGIYLDGTAGGAGHAAAIAQKLRGGHLYALDQDPAAIEVAIQRLQGLPATVLQGNFRNAGTLLAAQGIIAIDGALLDLGVSSKQLDDGERGFSYHQDAPLDMRMSQSGPGAYELVNEASRQELADILREYGEEGFAWQIAGKIISRREAGPIETTGQLAEIVAAALPAAQRRKSKNPARKTFQALRIAVNGEMDALGEGLDEIFAMLRSGGRFAIISFHSLEDRMVKQRFRTWCTACTCPPNLPVCVCGGQAEAKAVGKNPTAAGPEELEANRRSRSAKLRVVEKL